MIIQGLITFALYIFNFIIGLFPAQTLADVTNIVAIQDAFATVRPVFQAINFWFPVDYLFTCIEILIIWYFSKFVISVLVRLAQILSAGVIK